MPHIVIVEDETAIADTLIYALQLEGLRTTWLTLGSEALRLLQSGAGDLVLLDVGLPDMSGFDVCTQLRRFSDVPVIFLTARASEVDRVVGLELGADDYVVKPFSPREVAARVRAVLKRASANRVQPAQSPEARDASVFRVDADRLQIHYHGQLLQLTRHEFLLLQRLLAQPEIVLSREQLLAAAGVAEGAGYERTIDGHIRSLRAKLRAVAADAQPLQTHRGFGYSYRPEHS